MPPKKDAKKGSGNTFEVDPTLFQRECVEYPVAAENVPPLKTLMKSTLAKVDSVLPVWDIEGVNWSEGIAPEDVFAIKYPKNIMVQEGQALRKFLDLDVEEAVSDPKAKGKKPDAKKGAVAEALAEPAVDAETGKTLPRMYLENVDVQNTPIEHAGFTPAWPFYRKYDAAQKKRLAKFNSLTGEITAAQTAAAAAPEGNEEGQKGALNKIAIGLAKKYANELQANDVSKEVPGGDTVDPLLVSALEIVARVGPALGASAACSTAAAPKGGMQYLWRSIYPKLPDSDRPCYNPAGKYGVRLYLGGEWRIINVTDEVPLDSEGDRAIACSQNPLELWPMIIAKAIYTVYTKCGYIGSLSNPLDTSVHGACTRSASIFTAFAVHILTGWQPGSPLNLRECFDEDKDRTRTLRDEMVFGGAAFLAPERVPRSLEELLESENKKTVRSPSVTSATDGATTEADAGPTAGLRTKKQYKEEYMRKLSEREAVIATMQEREAQIADIEGLTKSAFSEVFSVCFRGKDNRLRVEPVLAVSYAKTDDADADVACLGDTRLLVGWQVVKKPILVEAFIDMKSLSAVEQYKASLPKLPKPTEIIMEWITMSEMCSANAFVIAHDTGLRTPCETLLPWGWNVDAPVEDAGAKGKAPAKGKGAVPAAPSGGLSLCVERGMLPPTLLRVTNSAFFSAAESAPVHVVEEGDEAAAALAAQAEELNKMNSSVVVPTAPSLSLSIMIHADLPVRAIPVEGETEPAEEVSLKLPSNVIVVLQEVREDDVDPLVMRVELGQGAVLPLTRATFHIPAGRVSPSESQPLLFWVRLYTQASVTISFGCGVAMEVGLAETIWAGCGAGYSSYKKEGTAVATAGDTEQTVFRLPLRLQNEEAGRETAFAYVHVSEQAITEHLACCLLMDHKVDPDDLQNNSKGEAGTHFATGTLESGNFGNSVILPRLGPSRISLDSKYNSTILCRCVANSARMGGVEVVDLPGFGWKTVVLTRSPLLPPANLQTCNKPARYIGAYYPNKDLALVKDVISVEKASFPLTMKFGLRKCADTGAAEADASVDSPAGKLLRAGKHTCEFIESICLKLQIKRKSDNRCIYETKGAGNVVMYNIVLDSFLAVGEVPPVRSADEAPPADAKGGKKDDKKGKGAAAGGGDDVIELVFELYIDESAMHIPDKWRSRLPYKFSTSLGGLDVADVNAVKDADEAVFAAAQAAVKDGSLPGAVPHHNIPRVLPQFLWQYDVLAGTVIAVSHDFRPLVNLNKLKEDWENLMPGRYEAGEAACKYFTRVKALREATPSEETKTAHYDDELIKTLEAAIWSKSPNDIQGKLDIIFTPEGKGNSFRENFVGKPEEVTYISNDSIQEMKAARRTENLRLCQLADEGLIQLSAFNAKLAEQTKVRITEIIDAVYASEVSSDAPIVEGEEVAVSSTSLSPLSSSMEANPTTIVGWWKQREKYRQDTDTLNQSLRVLLTRATDAIENAKIAEGGGDPKKGKKK